MTLYEDDGNTEMQQLIEAAVEHEIREINQMVGRWNELKSKPSEKIVIDEFNCRLVDGAPYEAEFDIAFQSPVDFLIGRHCVAATLNALNIRESVINIYDYEETVKVTASKDDIGRSLRNLRSLLQSISHEGPLIDGWNPLLGKDGEQNGPGLDALIESAIDHRRGEGDMWVMCWQELKNDTRSRLSSVEFIISGDSFTVGTPSGNTVEILQFLKPLVQKMHIAYLELTDTDPEVIVVCSNIFEPESVDHLALCPGHSKHINFAIWLDFVEKVRPSCVCYYRFGLIQEWSQFLIPLAEFVEALIVDRRDGELEPIPLSVVREIMKRQCKYLEIDDDTTVLSLDDAEKLVQSFSRMDKKVALKMYMRRTEPMNVTIGEYNVEIDDSTKTGILIEHLGIVPTFDEMNM